MKLISCDNCGIVYDQDRNIFPDQDTVDEKIDECDTEFLTWVDEDYVPFFKCVCGGEVLREK